MNTGASMSTFTWLVKREYWEYRGGFLWAPVTIAAVFLALMIIVLISAELAAQQHGINVNGIQLDLLKQSLSPEHVAKLNAGMDVGLLTLGFPIGIGLFFVVFFYTLGSLYNDRSDRSVLFWKSLPISDLHTVLAKVVAASLLAPAFAIVAMMALQLGFLILMTLFAAINGVNAISVLWSPLHLIRLWTLMILMIPVNALWALPTIGWLLLCSSFVRSKPFLWAVMLPLGAGFVVSWVHVMQQMALPNGWFWEHVVGRLLLSLVPGGWINQDTFRSLQHAGNDVPEAVAGLLSFDTIGAQLTSPDLLIGAVAGIAMIAAAVYFRRRRTEAYA
jgi:ABC-2 type transport system permease protein